MGGSNAGVGNLILGCTLEKAALVVEAKSGVGNLILLGGDCCCAVDVDDGFVSNSFRF